MNGNISRYTMVVMSIIIFCRILGLGEKLLLAYFFGTGGEVDAYLVAFTLAFTLFIITREIIKPSFLPVFISLLKDEGEGYAGRIASTFANLLIIVLIIIAVTGVIYAPFLIHLLAPGFASEQARLAIQLARLMLPASIVLGVSALTYFLLNAYKKFTLPALGDVSFKIVMILSLVAFYRVWGIRALAVGFVAGAVGQLMTHLSGLWQKKKLYRFSIHLNDPSLRKTGILMLPILIGVAFSHLNSIIANMFASTLSEGSIAALSYARKITDLPLLIFPFALGIVAFPHFSELSRERDRTQLTTMFSQALRVITFVFFPLSVGTIILAVPLTRLLFERGHFTSQSTQLTAGALVFYAVGMLTFALEIIVVQFYYAFSDTKTPVLVGLFCVVLNIVATFFLIQYLEHRGVALALSLSKSIKIIILLVLLQKKFVTLPLPELGKFLVRLVMAVAVMGTIVYFLYHYYLPGTFMTMGGFSSQLIKLMVSTGSGLIAFLAAVLLLQVREAKLSWWWVRDKIAIGRVSK